ncbi:MAG: Gfo/Idh/MocA family oxidoreductase [Planctomycetota bacterium]
MNSRQRYAIVGTGGRSRMYTDAICREYADHADLVAWCDTSQTRMDYWNRHLANEFGHDALPTYRVSELSLAAFDDMIDATKPDLVIVTSVDATHDRYIIRAMERGCDAISEKPMTTTAEKCAAIFEAIERTGQTLRVAFNYRWQPTFSAIKQIVASGQIGTPTLVDFQWRLDTQHGADYFRRWHREKQHSGGLLVHKSTHHFDLVNWILDDHPQSVYGDGGLMFYGENNARRRGVVQDYERYADLPSDQTDPFALHMDGRTDGLSGGSELAGLYRNAEQESGYIRDRNVFAGEDKWPITAEDTLAITARFTKGTVMSYSLVAYCPWEGERLAVTGTEGQVEYFGRGQGHVIAGQSDEQLAQEQYQGEKYIRLQRMFEEPQTIPIPEAKGGHGGGDAKLLERIFIPDGKPDELGRDATHIDGAKSVLFGVAANRSIENKAPIRFADLWPASAPKP